MKQPSFASLAYDGKKKQTRKELFLAEMDRIIPWRKLTRLIEPHYPKTGNRRPPMGPEKMLRIHFMQQWFKLLDPAMEDALYDTEPPRRFAGIELGQDPVPDESTILKFRHLLEKHDLAAKLFEATCGYLEENGLLLREGTIVDATLIDAPSIHDSVVMEDLLHGGEESVYGDKAYADETRKRDFEERGIKWCVSRKAGRGHRLSEKDEGHNRRMSKTRAKGEHPFHVVKCLWGHRKARYRGITKNASQLFTLFSLANLYLVRKQLLHQPA